MSVLITGATGYIGSRLAAECVRNGVDTHVIVRPTSDLRRLPAEIGGTKVHVFDGSMASLENAIGTANPDIVFHLASLFVVQHSPAQIPALIESNVLFGTLLLEAMVAKSVFGFVNTGTSWQHYESEEYNPVNLYAATKKAFEVVLRYFTSATPLKSVTLELPDTFGPDDPRPKIVNILINSIRKESTLQMTPGEQFLDLVHVDDVVNAFLIAARLLVSMETKCGVYSLSSGRPVRLRDLAAFVESISKDRARFLFGSRPYRFREVMSAWTGGEKLPGWSPARPVEDFLKTQIVDGEADHGSTDR